MFRRSMITHTHAHSNVIMYRSKCQTESDTHAGYAAPQHNNPKIGSYENNSKATYEHQTACDQRFSPTKPCMIWKRREAELFVTKGGYSRVFLPSATRGVPKPPTMANILAIATNHSVCVSVHPY